MPKFIGKHNEDDGRVYYGADEDYFFQYSSGNTALELWTANGDGSDTETKVLSITDGTDDIVAAAGLSKVEGVVGIPLDICKKDAAMITPLPAAGDATNLGLVDGITGAMHLVGSDADGTTVSESCGFMVAIPDWYVAGSTITLRARAGLLTTVATGTATLDVNAYILGDDDAISADLCETAATSINSLTMANKDFVINDDATGEVIGPGDVLQVKLTAAITDDGTGGAKLAKISELKLVISA